MQLQTGLTRLRDITQTGNWRQVLQRRLGRHNSDRRLLFEQPLDADTRVPGIINSLLSTRPSPHSYLEIGVYRGATIENVKATRRVAVDPRPQFERRRLPEGLSVYPMTSDQYFSQCVGDSFDFVYIDGEHTHEQSYRDFLNATSRLAPNGIILFDDSVPEDNWAAIPDETESHQKRFDSTGVSCGAHQGDVWKTIIAISRFHPEFEIATLQGPSRYRTLAIASARRSTPVSHYPTGSLDRLTYEDVFRGGVPVEFRVTSLESVLSRLRTQI